MSAFGKNISEEAICLFEPGLSKHEALDRMIEAVMKTGHVKNRQAFQAALFEREAIRSTGFKGIAIPHVRIDEITSPTVGVGISKGGIDFESLDNEPVHIVVMFAMPSGSDKIYLGVLAQIMMALRSGGFSERLIACESPAEVKAILAEVL
jgi:mannitol/fructose-specific phosphotransferase system IIA component (Ntr-type)